MRILFKIIISLLLMSGMQAQEKNVSPLYIFVGDYYLEFESVNTLIENITAKLIKENIEVVIFSDPNINNLPSPSIVIVETDLEGHMLSIGSAETPLRGLSTILESNYGYAFSVDNLNSDETVDAVVGYSLYVLERCEQAINYLGEDQRNSSSSFALEAVTAFYAGNCSLLMDDLNSAIVYFHRSIALTSNYGNFPASNNLTWTYLQLGERGKAFEFFDELTRIARDRTDTSYLRFLLFRRIQLYFLAIRLDLGKLFN